MTSWYGNATPVELTAAARWLRSGGKSRSAAYGMIKHGLIAVEPKPPHLTERGQYVVDRLPDGFVEQRKSRATGKRISIYETYEAGIDAEPDMVDGQDYNRYSVVCEAHGSIMQGGPTLAAARKHAADSAEWCSVCQEAVENPKPCECGVKTRTRIPNQVFDQIWTDVCECTSVQIDWHDPIQNLVGVMRKTYRGNDGAYTVLDLDPLGQEGLGRVMPSAKKLKSRLLR
jgi:hypothetical protein